MRDLTRTLLGGRTPRSRAEVAVESLVAALLLFAPLAFGATEPWSLQICLVLIAAAAVVSTVDVLLRPGGRPTWTWAYVPIGLFLLLVLAQLLPLPAGWVAAVSPQTVATKARLLAGVETAGGAGPLTLSFYPQATARQLQTLLGVVALFAVVLQTHRRSEQVRGLLLAATAAGLVVALIAVGQNVANSDRAYGLRPTGLDFSVPAGHRFSGPFMNHSHFSQFMNLSIGAALGLMLALGAEALAPAPVRRSRRGDRSGRRTVALPPPSRSPLAMLRDRRADPRLRVAAALAGFAVLGAVTVFLAMSRMGMLSLLTAGALTAVAFGVRGRSRRSADPRGASERGGAAALIVALGLAVVAVLLAVGFESVYDRLATLRHAETAQAGRTQILRDLTVAWRQYPAVGLGLGTFEKTFPMFDTSSDPNLATHAENEYAQLLTETGVAGVAAAGAFALIVAGAWWRATGAKDAQDGSANRPIRAAAFGLGFGLVAILIHSASDFGQHVPANAFLTASFCAVLIRLARRSPRRGEAEATAPTSDAEAARLAAAPAETPALAYRRPRFFTASWTDWASWANPWAWRPGVVGRLALGVVALAIVGGWGVWAVASTDAWRRAEVASRAAGAAQRRIAETVAAGEVAGDDAYITLIGHAAVAAELQPQDVDYAFDVNAARWDAISREFDPATGGPVPGSPTAGFARRIADRFNAARALCPTDGRVVSMAGQIELFALGDPAGRADLRLAYRLAPYDPWACFNAGRLDLAEGKAAGASKKFERAAALSASVDPAVVDQYLAADDPAAALAFAAGDRGLLLRTADALDRPDAGAFAESVASTDPRPAALALDRQARWWRAAQSARRASAALVRAAAESPDAAPGDWVAYAEQRAAAGDRAAAIALVRRALGREYGQVDWRLRLARLLADDGQTADAIREAQLCLRQRPGWPEAVRLIEELSVGRTAAR